MYVLYASVNIMYACIDLELSFFFKVSSLKREWLANSVLEFWQWFAFGSSWWRRLALPILLMFRFRQRKDFLSSFPYIFPSIIVLRMEPLITWRTVFLLASDYSYHGSAFFHHFVVSLHLSWVPSSWHPPFIAMSTSRKPPISPSTLFLHLPYLSIYPMPNIEPKAEIES